MSGELTKKLNSLVADQLGVDLCEIRPDSNLLDDLGADSLDIVELVMAIEENFDIEISDEDAEVIRTVGDVEKYIAERVAAA